MEGQKARKGTKLNLISLEADRITYPKSSPIHCRKTFHGNVQFEVIDFAVIRGHFSTACPSFSKHVVLTRACYAVHT